SGAATSHEDTSPDRHNAARLRPRLSASVTSQLSLHPSINTRPRVPNRAPGGILLLQTRPPAPLGDAGGGGERDRTDDLLLAKQALSQLSYTPVPEVRNQNTEISLF